MSIAILKDEFLKLDKTGQIDFGKFVLEKLFSTIESESVLSEEQQKEVEKRHFDLKSGESKGMSLTEFKIQMKEKYDL